MITLTRHLLARVGHFTSQKFHHEIFLRLHKSCLDYKDSSYWQLSTIFNEVHFMFFIRTLIKKRPNKLQEKMMDKVRVKQAVGNLPAPFFMTQALSHVQYIFDDDAAELEHLELLWEIKCELNGLYSPDTPFAFT